MDLKQLIKTRSSNTATSNRPLNIVFATGEVVPYSKTGGLADVSASLSKALARRGHRVTIITPLYRFIDPKANHFAQRLTPLSVPRKAKSQRKLDATLWEHRLDTGVTVIFVDAPEVFHRNDLYGYDGADVEDAVERFSFFSRAIVEFCREMPIPVDVLHLNDWHTALAPVYLEHYYGNEDNITTVMSLHNIAFQGRFSAESFAATGLPKSLLAENELSLEETFVFLKGAIKHCDAVTTVSPTHAKEITAEPGGFGLAAELNQREGGVLGILNGADYTIWSPDHDAYIPVPYTIESLNGKRQNKTALQHELGLPVRPTLPLLGFIGRLTAQKGVDILAVVLKKMLESMESEREGFQVALIGQGESTYAQKFQALAEEFPSRVTFVASYSEEFAHKILAASDILLVPSRFEPCGLTQIYGLKYGTIPIVHATGGLNDTVIDSSKPHSTGFSLEKLNTRTLTQGIEQAVKAYHKHRQWRPMMARAMAMDFSWGQSAIQYEELYYQQMQKRGVSIKGRLSAILESKSEDTESSSDQEPPVDVPTEEHAAHATHAAHSSGDHSLHEGSEPPHVAPSDDINAPPVEAVDGLAVEES